MASAYLSSVTGSDSYAGTSISTAKATLAAAESVADDSEPGTIFVDYRHSETLSNTAAFSSGVGLVSIDFLTNAYRKGAFFISTTYRISFSDRNTLCGAIVVFRSQSYSDTILTTNPSGVSFYDCTFYIESRFPICAAAHSNQLMQLSAKNCEFIFVSGAYLGTSGTEMMYGGFKGLRAYFEGCKFSWYITEPHGYFRGFYCRNDSYTGAAALLTFVSCDFSEVTKPLIRSGELSSYYLDNLMSSTYVTDGDSSFMVFKACKFSSPDYAIVDTTYTKTYGPTVYVVGNDTDEYFYKKETPTGKVVMDYSVYRSGTNAKTPYGKYSLKLVSNSVGLTWPMATDYMFFAENTSTGTKTVTLEFLHDGSSSLTDRDIWIELLPYDDANKWHTTVFTSTRNDFVASATTYSSGVGTSSWTKGTATTGWISQKITKSISVAKTGLLPWRVKLIKSNYVVYLDGIITLS